MTTLHPHAKAFLLLVEGKNIPSTRSIPMELARGYDEWLLELRGPVEQVAHIQDLSVPGTDGEVRIRIYRPEATDALPVLCYFHGGGWALGNLETVDRLCRSLAKETPCVVVSVDYRLAPENPFPAGLDDCYDVTTWVARNASTFGGDPTRLAVGGDSAGGTLAAAVTLVARDLAFPTLTYQLLIYPVTDPDCSSATFDENSQTGVPADEIRWFWDIYLAGADENDPRAAPIRAESLAGLPPAFILTAEGDTFRGEAEHYAQRLDADGVAVDLRCYAGQVHGFVLMPAINDAARPAISDMAQALRRALDLDAPTPSASVE